MPREAQTGVQAPPIDAFGDGGFRIAGVRKEGDTLIVANAARAWTRAEETLSADDFAVFLGGPERPDMVLLGTGARLTHPAAEVRKAFREAGVGLEVVDTATACRTYNLLAGEGRKVGAALIAI